MTYTFQSGSTGNPKGVVLTHGNLINCLLSLLVIATQAVGEVQDDDIHIAFLPLAHVLELLAENAYIILGVAIGYSSPYTLTDTSLSIKKGQVMMKILTTFVIKY
jgi:long-chain acyl-CoA synthetase